VEGLGREPRVVRSLRPFDWVEHHEFRVAANMDYLQASLALRRDFAALAALVVEEADGSNVYEQG